MGEPPQKIRLEISPQAEKYVRADAPRETRLMAARGALPLPPLELATALFALMHDPDAEVKGKARESLEALPDAVMGTVLSGAVHPAVLDHLARHFIDDERRLEAVALNNAASDDTYAFLAACHHRKVVEIVSGNQSRLMRHPPIVDALGDNPLTGRAMIERILSFLDREPDPDSEDEELQSAEDVGDDEARAALAAVLGDDFERFVVERPGDEDFDESVLEDAGSLYAVVQNLSVFQKVKLARMGNKEARGLLVRDRNKIVAMAAITSPKITENELVAIAKSRNVCDEVIRVVSMNKELTRNYQVKLALATNPKTQQAMAMKFVNYLQDKDLKSLMKSKDVPSVISMHARRILMRKGKV